MANKTKSHISNIEFSQEQNILIEILSRYIHKVWTTRLIAEGWIYGEEQNDIYKTHPCLVSYEEFLYLDRKYYLSTILDTLELITSKDSVMKGHRTDLIDSTAIIGNNVQIGNNTVVKGNVYLGDSCQIGDECKLHRNVFVDENVVIGNRVKIQNNNSIYGGVTLEDGVFVGPHATFTNDKYPRSITPDGKLKDASDWLCVNTLVKKGASIGGGSTIICGITIGEWAMIGAGSVVTKDIPPHALVVGNPAKIIGWVSKSGNKMRLLSISDNTMILHCDVENKEYKIITK